MYPEIVVRLARQFANHRCLTIATVSTYAANDGKVIGRLERGADLTSRRAGRIVQWFSDHWPAELDWPADIPRPDASPGSPASLPQLTSADPMAAVMAAKDAMNEAMVADMPDFETVAHHEDRMLRSALTLRDDGRIASVEALCLALGSRRHVYDDVVRRYADGRGGAQPRNPRSDTGRMLQALVASGDHRFSERRGEAA